MILPLLEPLTDLFTTVLHTIHSTTGLTWAWSIIALTAIVRIAILPLTAKQTQSMLRMQRLQPHVKQLQDRYKDDRQELNQRLLEFYRDNKANPMASCLPMLVQIPIFIGLFYTLKDFNPPGVDASQDLSFLFGFVSDITFEIDNSGATGWILMAFYVASQVLSSRVMAVSADPKQRMLFYILPFVFIPAIKGFPIGVMLYWITTNLWTLGQHLTIVKLSNTNFEIVLPEDTRGNKRVLPAKGGSSGKQGSKQSSSKQQSGASQGSSPAPVRRNKRRK